MKKTIEWGILGTAGIAVKAFIPAVSGSSKGRIRAIASRSREKAEKFASLYGIPSACGSYDELIQDPDIDAVYIPLPNHLHAMWCVKALEHGKNVLCEKPLAMNAGEVKTIIDAAARSGKIAAEAFMVKFHPQWLKLREIVSEKTAGSPLLMNSVFAYYNDDPSNIRNMAECGGGALYDIGCYPVVCSRFIFESEPEKVFATSVKDPESGTDTLTTAVMDFPAGDRSVFSVSTRTARSQRVFLYGTMKTVELPAPFNPPTGSRTHLFLSETGGSGRLDISFETCDHYAYQAESFADAVTGECPYPFPLEDSLFNARVMDALFRSAETGEWQKP